MASFERETVINAPPEKVFAYLSDIPRHTEWAQHRIEIEPVADGPAAQGSMYNCVGHQMGTHHGQVTITELIPMQKIVYESEDDTGHFRHYIMVTAEDGKSRVTKGFESLKLSLMFQVLSPVARFLVPKGLDGDLSRIKAKLEGQPGG